jgi:LacI family transcriptional regulator
VARYVEIEAREFGYSIVLCDTQENAEIEIESIRLLQSRNVDGLIISPVGKIGPYLKELRDGGLPVVLLDRYFPGVDLPYVTSDNYRGAHEATEYLISMGHRQIACIMGLPEASTNIDRVAGFRDALAKHGIAANESWILGNDFSEHNGYMQARQLMQSRPRPTAIFSLGNLPTFGAIRAIQEADLSIPEDVSLISFDDHFYADFLATPLTAVAQQMEKIGKVAVNLLYDQLDGKPGPGKRGLSIATRLNIRSSVSTRKAVKERIEI